jgi:hypothetical protein
MNLDGLIALTSQPGVPNSRPMNQLHRSSHDSATAAKAASRGPKSVGKQGWRRRGISPAKSWRYGRGWSIDGRFAEVAWRGRGRRRRAAKNRQGLRLLEAARRGIWIEHGLPQRGSGVACGPGTNGCHVRRRVPRHRRATIRVGKHAGSRRAVTGTARYLPGNRVPWNSGADLLAHRGERSSPRGQKRECREGNDELGMFTHESLKMRTRKCR